MDNDKSGHANSHSWRWLIPVQRIYLSVYLDTICVAAFFCIMYSDSILYREEKRRKKISPRPYFKSSHALENIKSVHIQNKKVCMVLGTYIT